MARPESLRLSRAAWREIDARNGIARQDMAFGLAPFIRPQIRGQRAYIEGVSQPWNGGILEISGPQIDSDDLGVLLALLTIAVQNEQSCGQLVAGQQAEGLIPEDRAAPANKALQNDSARVETTMAEICRQLGRNPEDGSAHRAIRASIKRLAAVVVEARSGEDWAATHLIAGAAGRGRGAVRVKLSYRLTRALIGEGSYSRIKMETWRSLAPVARVLYHWLCAWRPGGGACPLVSVDALTKHVWGEVATGAKQRERRQQVRLALAAMRESGEWRIESMGANLRIERMRAHPAETHVVLATQTRGFGYAPPSGKTTHTRLSHEV